jgi:hypothetical protein
MNEIVKAWYRRIGARKERRHRFGQVMERAPASHRAHEFVRGYRDVLPDDGEPAAVAERTNPLWEYFASHKEGNGIWKWEHYFDVYHRHLSQFVGREVNLLEIGIYSGGSLGMWRSYFGERSHIYGVDIEDACRAYEDEHVSVFIGDQADRSFWVDSKEEVRGIDILIDDGGHTAEQQQVSLEEMLPYLRPGGVYVCEDVHGRYNQFAAFAAGLVDELNEVRRIPGPLLQSEVTPFQASVYSLHFYPYIMVIEKHQRPMHRLAAPKHGTRWQPFL